MRYTLMIYLMWCWVGICLAKTTDIAKIVVHADYLTDVDTLEIRVWDDQLGNPAYSPCRVFLSTNMRGQYTFQIDGLSSQRPARISMTVSHQKLRGFPLHGIFDQILINPGDSVFLTLLPRQGKYSPVQGGYDTGDLIFENNWNCIFSGNGALKMQIGYDFGQAIKSKGILPIKEGEDRVVQLRNRLTDVSKFQDSLRQKLSSYDGRLSRTDYKWVYYDVLGRHYRHVVEHLNKEALRKSFEGDELRVNAIIHEFLDDSGLQQNDDLVYIRNTPDIVNCWAIFCSLNIQAEKTSNSLAARVKNVEVNILDEMLRTRVIASILVDRFYLMPDRDLLMEQIRNVGDDYVRGRLQALKVLVDKDKKLSFELPDLSGRIVRDSEFSGKIVLMDFWYMSCIPCRAYIEKVLRPLLEYYKDDAQVVVIMVSVDNRQTLELAVRQGLVPDSAISLYTEDKKFKHPIISEFGIRAFPYPILIDQERTIVKSGQQLKDLRKIVEWIEELKNKKAEL